MASLRGDFLDACPLFYPDLDNYNHVTCKYSDIDVFSNFKFGCFLNILLFNIRSLRKNFSQFLAHFSFMFVHFSFILLTEIWLDSDSTDTFCLPGFYKFDLCRNNYGGGVRLFIKDGIQASILPEYTMINDFIEILTIACTVNNCKCIVSLVYHPPSASHVINNIFVDTLLSLLSRLKRKQLPLIVGGDINLNLLNPYNFGYVNSFITGMFELGLVPAINIPTKVNVENLVTKYSIIDQFWVSGVLNISNACVIPADLTDHFPVGLTINLHSTNVTSAFTCNQRPLTDAGKNSFRIFLSNVNIAELQGNHNLNMSNYMSNLWGSYNSAFPLRQVKEKDINYTPWISHRLKLCIRKKSKLYKQYMCGRVSRVVYTMYRNQLTTVLRKAKRLYYVELFYHAGFASKQVWSIIDSIITKKRGQTLQYLEINGSTLTGLPLVNYVNNYFASAALTVTRGLYPPVNYPFLTPPIVNSCFFYPTTPVEVRKVICNLSNKGSKLNDIPPLLIKENKDLFSDQLAVCYNSSLEQSIYPDVLKIGRITPAHKSGSETQIDNYRPISALPSISKIYETLTLNRMMSFIFAHSILSVAQYGFRQGKSTTQAITKLLSNITKAYHCKNYCVCFFLDLRKAFDTINHNILFRKLYHYGFRGDSHEYLKSYFNNRKQYVCLNDLKSNIEDITCGVPQGSILGPLCFNLYINDLPLAVSEECVLFADDAAFVVVSSDLTDLFTRIEKLFADINQYLSQNCLVPNATKSKLMMFSSRTTAELPEFVFSGGKIEWVSEFKYLGLILTNKLSFAKHINKVMLNVSRITGMMKSVRDFLPVSVCFKLYQALALPHVNLHLEIWGSAPAYLLNMLEIKMNNLLRVVFGIYRDGGIPVMGTREMYSTYGILRLKSMYNFKLFKLLRSLAHGCLPELYDILLRPYITSHGYETRRNTFRHPNLTCEIERRFLSYQLIVLNELLPPHLFENSLSSSLRQLRRHLLSTQ